MTPKGIYCNYKPYIELEQFIQCTKEKEQKQKKTIIHKEIYYILEYTFCM